MKITPKSKTNCFLLKVRSKTGFYYGCNWVYIKLKPEDLVWLDYIKRLFKNEKEKDGNLHEISFLNNLDTAWLEDDKLPPDFVEMLEKLDDETLEIEPITEIEDDMFLCDVEIVIMKVDEYGIYFTCFFKDSDIELETHTLKI
jgi:hypothetical protein